MANCSHCGTANADDAGYCTKCGQPLETTLLPRALTSQPVSPPRTNPLSVASLLLGLVSLFPLFGILAVVLGHIARAQIRKSAGGQKGAGMALAGLILGYLGLGFIAFLILVVLPELNWH